MTDAEVLSRILIEMRLARASHSERRDGHVAEKNFDGAARESHKEEAVRKLLQTVEKIIVEAGQ
jgi:hypothetical protein